MNKGWSAIWQDSGRIAISVLVSQVLSAGVPPVWAQSDGSGGGLVAAPGSTGEASSAENPAPRGSLGAEASEKVRESAKQSFIETRDLARELNQEGAYSDSLSLWDSYIATLDSKPMLRCRASVHRGYVLARLGKYDRALDNFDYAIANAPHLPPVIATYCFFWRGRTLVKLGRIADAVCSYSMAEARNTDPELTRYILNGEANCLTKLGRFEEALSVFQRLEAMDKESDRKIPAVKEAGPSLPPAPTGNLTPVGTGASSSGHRSSSVGSSSKTRLPSPSRKPASSKPSAPRKESNGMPVRQPGKRASTDGQNRKASIDDDLLSDIILADKTKEVDEYSGLLCSGSSDSESYYGRGIALLCLSKYRQAALDFKNYLERADWTGQAPYQAVVFCRLSDILSGHPQISSLLLARAANSISRDNRLGATVRYLVDPTTERTLITSSSSESSMTRAHCVIGIVALAKGNKAVARKHLDWVRERGDKRMDEYLVTVSLAKRTGMSVR